MLFTAIGASFYSTLVAGLAITAVALVMIPKEYTSSVMLEVWHADIQQNLIGAEPETAPRRSVIWNRVWRLSAKKPSRSSHLAELIAKHGLYLRDGKPEPGAIGQMADAISISIPEQYCSQRPRIVGEKLLPPDAVEISFQYPDPAKAQAVANDSGEYHDRRVPQGTRAPQRGNYQAAFERTRGDQGQAGRDPGPDQNSEGEIPRESAAGPEDNVKALEALQMQLERSAQGADNKTDASEAAAPDSPKPNTPEASLAALKTKLVALRAQYSDEYPEVIETKSQIAILEKEVAQPGQQPAVATASRFGCRLDPAANGGVSARDCRDSGA